MPNVEAFFVPRWRVDVIKHLRDSATLLAARLMARQILQILKDSVGSVICACKFQSGFH